MSRAHSPRIVVVMLLALAVAAVGWAAGCPAADGAGAGPGGAGDDDGTGGVVDTGCARDEECGAGEICDVASGDCGAGLDCTANAALCDFCGSGGTDCGFGEAAAYCSADAGVCRRQQGECGPCEVDEQCAESSTGLASVCNAGFCTVGCGACPPGFACDGGGCVPSGGIARCDGAILCGDGGEACPDGQTCSELDVCLALCFADVDCGAGQVCELAVGPGQNECRAGCPLGETVQQGGVELVCHADGRFGERCPTPDSALGCPDGTTCDAEGVCQRAGCQSDDECPLPRTFCDLATAACVDGCNSVDDCGAFEACEAGQCAPLGCVSANVSCDLGEWCCGADAFTDASTCGAGVVDGDCFVTPEPWCRTCESNEDCADVPSLCYELQNGDGQNLGKYCAPPCGAPNECPRGIDCIADLPTEEEGVTTTGCLDTLCFEIAAARSQQ